MSKMNRIPLLIGAALALAAQTPAMAGDCSSASTKNYDDSVTLGLKLHVENKRPDGTSIKVNWYLDNTSGSPEHSATINKGKSDSSTLYLPNPQDDSNIEYVGYVTIADSGGNLLGTCQATVDKNPFKRKSTLSGAGCNFSGTSCSRDWPSDADHWNVTFTINH